MMATKQKVENVGDIRKFSSKFETRLKSQWILEIPGFDSHIFKSVTRPRQDVNRNNPLRVVLYDPMNSDVVPEVSDWLQNGDPRRITLKELDRSGNVLRVWAYIDAKPTSIDLGEMSYDSNDVMTISMYLDYLDVEYENRT